MNPAPPSLPQFAAGGAVPLLWLVLGAVILVTAYYAFAEFYHWLRWGYMYPLVWVALPVYVIGIAVLVGAMLTGIALF